MSHDAIFSILSRATRWPRDLVYRRRVSSTDASAHGKESTYEDYEEEEATYAGNFARMLQQERKKKLVDELV